MTEDKLTNLTQYEIFYTIAYHHFLEAKKLQDKRMKCIEGLGNRDPNSDELHVLSETGWQLSHHAVTAVIFSAISLEAYINDYGIRRFSKSFFKEHLDKLKIVSKWVVIPRMTVGKTLDTSARPFQRLKVLFSLRDKIVHFKSRQIGSDSLKEDDFVVFPAAENAIETVRTVIQALGQIDPMSNASWVQFTENMGGMPAAVAIPKEGRNTT